MNNIYKWVFIGLLPAVLPPGVWAQSVNEHCDRGFGYYQKKDYDRAIAEYTAAITLDPSGSCGTKVKGIAYSTRGNVYILKQDYAGAIADQG